MCFTLSKSFLLEYFLESKDILLLNFYADWCRFSQMLRPIYDKAADMLHAENVSVCAIVCAGDTLCPCTCVGGAGRGWIGQTPMRILHEIALDDLITL